MTFHKAIAIAAVLALGACTAAAPKPAAYQLEASNKYVPINLDIYAGEYVTPQLANIVRYMGDTFSGSNLFTDVSRGFKRWPVTIQLKYVITRDSNPVEFAGVMLSAATLLILPAPLTEVHKLEATIYSGSTQIKTYQYDAEVGVTMSLFHNPEEARKAGANGLIQKLYMDLAKDKVIPKVRDLAPSVKTAPAGDNAL